MTHPDFSSLRAVVCDLNGVFRGKRIAPHQYDSILQGKTRMPLSVVSSDIWGNDTSEIEEMFSTGDQDGRCLHTGREPLSMTWLDDAAAFIPLWMFQEDGSPYHGDPRQVLSAVIKRLHKVDLFPVMGVELEFYLIDKNADLPTAPTTINSGSKIHSNNVLSLEDIDSMAPLFDELFATCSLNNIDVDSAISEGGVGQYEVILNHCDDPLKLADDVLYFRAILRGLATKYGLKATFMAKPYAKRAGNGLHVHTSMLDKSGTNVFDSGNEAGSETLHSGIGGLLKTMGDATLLFAPHRNSYRRLESNSHAPTNLTWGYENRTASVRIPGGPGSARRIEHRVAGGDANPYLHFTSVLGGLLYGIENSVPAPMPTIGNAYESDAAALPDNWRTAIERFQKSTLMPFILPEIMIKNLVACKKQELSIFEEPLSAFEFRTMTDAV